MEKFQKLILKLAETHPNRPLTTLEKTLVQDRLNKLSSQYQTPDHPPYSAMIERAIRELNEKRGSTENSISQFLEKEYNNHLPWAHSILLKHHLQKLYESEDIVLTRTNKYMIAGEVVIDPTPNSTITKSRKRKRKPSKRHGDKGRKNRKRENREDEVQETGEIKNGVFGELASTSTTPERPPGFEEELCDQSKRRERQLRRWSRKR
ncbi:hypothetical protein ACJIZ3_019593 [Penstemon smallii]|uniref:H15 domain-containing protein n=1 Tax=Penstemon smallii TaxID=265156 RepID=A0ABD3T2C6_9LAMI